MIAFKTKLAQNYTDSELKQQQAIIIARVFEVNINKITGKRIVFWRYFVEVANEFISIFPKEPARRKEYTRQQVEAYHGNNPTTVGALLPQTEDELYLKSLKKQVADDNVLGLNASDWETY